MTTEAPVILRRDGVTLVVYAVLATWGWFLYGFGPMLPLLRDEQGTSRTQISLHSVALALGAVVAGSLAVPLARAIRRRGAAVLGAALVAGGVSLLLAGRTSALTLPAALVIGIGGSTMVNTTAPVVTEHHGLAGAAALSEGNALAAATGLLAPAAIGAGVAAGLTWRPGIGVTILLAGLIMVVARRAPRDTPALDDAPPPRPRGAGGRVPRGVWPPLLMLVACVGVEFCVVAWAADLLRQQVGLDAGPASAAVSLVVAGMAIGRLALGRLALRRPPRPLLAAALATAAAGWAITWWSGAVVPALIGLAVLGLGIAGHYPMGTAILLESADGQRDRVIGMLSLGIGAASGGGPFALGALADAHGPHTAFLVVPALLAVAALLLAAAVRRPTRAIDAAAA